MEGKGPIAPRQSQVENETDSINSTLHSLQDSVTELASRLERVLRNQPGQECPTDKAVMELAPLASELNSFCGRIGNVNGIIVDLLDRLEV